MDWIIARPANLRWASKVFRLYQISGLQSAVRASGLLRPLRLNHWDAQLPPIPAQPSWQHQYIPTSTPRATVGLFTGCVANVLDPATSSASIRLLNKLGYKVQIPPAQVCCGALHQHAGLLDKAAALMRQNLRAFAESQLQAVISTASGCGAMLMEYADWLPDDPLAHAFSAKVQDISQYLANAEWPEGTRPRSSNIGLTVAVHDPCTLRNVARSADAPYRLLERLADIKLKQLPENNVCCGAAGAYFLTEPAMANDLRADKIEHLRRIAPDIVVTSNVGCALHLAQGVRESGLRIKITHPAVLIEKQLQASGV
ncbi:MAG: (Fe-S)-binding protein [Acidiferrobacterales bacterium]